MHCLIPTWNKVNYIIQSKSVPRRSIFELESLGLSSRKLNELNDDYEIDSLVENIKQGLIQEYRFTSSFADWLPQSKVVLGNTNPLRKNPTLLLVYSIPKTICSTPLQSVLYTKRPALLRDHCCSSDVVLHSSYMATTFPDLSDNCICFLQVVHVFSNDGTDINGNHAYRHRYYVCTFVKLLIGTHDQPYYGNCHNFAK